MATVWRRCCSPVEMSTYSIDSPTSSPTDTHRPASCDNSSPTTRPSHHVTGIHSQILSGIQLTAPTALGVYAPLAPLKPAYYDDKRTHTHIRLTALCPRLPGWAGTRKVKTNLDFTEARDSEWQWHQLGHMQVCPSLQTDSLTMPAPHHSVFLQAGCPSCRATNSVKALKANQFHYATLHYWNSLPDFIRDPANSTDCFTRLRLPWPPLNPPIMVIKVTKIAWRNLS